MRTWVITGAGVEKGNQKELLLKGSSQYCCAICAIGDRLEMCSCSYTISTSKGKLKLA